MKALTHDFTATYQEGIVSQVDAKRHKVKCTLPALDDLETGWLSFLTPNSGGNQFYCLPDTGELVAILLDARGEGGCVLGTMYNEQDPTPTANAEIWIKKFSNGTEISHNRESGEIIINTQGQVVITASGGVVINAKTTINEETTINAKTTINGDLTISGTSSASDHMSGGTSGKNHTHTQGAGDDFGAGGITSSPN